MRTEKPDLYLWSECRKGRHQECAHVAATGSLTLRGASVGVSRCTCNCHSGCPASLVDPRSGIDALLSVCIEEVD
jgi:hypothetical protein